MDHAENKGVLLPRSSTSQKTLRIATQKLNSITVTGKSLIEFTKLDGRPDYIDNTSTKLTDITITDAFGNRRKHFALNYSYQGAGSRLFLDGVIEYGTIDIEPKATRFGYDRPELLPSRFSNDTDFWGYFNHAGNLNNSFPKSPLDGILSGADKDVNSSYLTVGVLTSMRYPTGGRVILDFESNTASYQGNRLLAINEIPENLAPAEEHFIIGNGNYTATNTTETVNVDFDQSVSMAMYINNYSAVASYGPEHLNNFMYTFRPMKMNSSGTMISDSSRDNFDISLSEAGCNDSNCTLLRVLKKGVYYVKLTYKQGNFINLDPVIQFELDFVLSKYVWNQHFTKGGGVRIKKLTYVDDTATIKAKNYSYQNPTNSNISSGSFAYPFPKYYYDQIVNTALYVPFTVGPILVRCYQANDFYYKSYTNFNNQNPVKTKGSDIGYKYVKVYEENNGWVLNEFTSPIDFPEDEASNFPFTSNKDFDYKRGLKLKQTIYEQNARILSEETFAYIYQEKLPIIGFVMRSSPGCGWSRLYVGYPDYKVATEGTASPGCFFHCYAPSGTIRFTVETPASGWAKLQQKVTTRHLYQSPTDLVGRAITEKESYIYNAINKALSVTEHIDAEGLVTATKYYYPDDVTSISTLAGGNLAQVHLDAINMMKNAAKHYISIPIQTENYVNGNLTDIQRTLYKNWGDMQFYPEIIQTAKGTATLQNRIRFNQVDTNGNPLELQRENGPKICYIWGYNKTYPVARIENIEYSSINPSTITTIQTASNSILGQSALPSLLASLRLGSPLTSMVSTYTYLPQVGISVATDPTGNSSIYTYDTQGRLLSIKDTDGNILSTNAYHYGN